jgi:hypothetical protein
MIDPSIPVIIPAVAALWNVRRLVEFIVIITIVASWIEREIDLSITVVITSIPALWNMGIVRLIVIVRM